MCDPITITMATVALASGGLQAKQQRDTDKWNIKTQELQAVANRDNYLNTFQANNLELKTRTQALYEDALARRQQGLREASMIRVASAEAGVAGSSAVDRAMVASEITRNIDLGNVQTSVDNATLATSIANNSLFQSTRMTNAGLGRFKGAYDPLMAILSIGMQTGGAAMQGMTTAAAMKGPSTPTSPGVSVPAPSYSPSNPAPVRNYTGIN